MAYHVARVFVHDVVGILRDITRGIDKRDFRLILTIDTGRQLNSLEEYTARVNYRRH